MSDIVKNNQLPISSLADITALGKMIAASGMFGIKNDDAGAIAAATCFQQNITLLDFARTYHIIEGRPTMKADAMAAEFRKRGGKYKVIERSVSLAKAEFEFEGQCCNFEFSIKQAQDAGFCYSGDKKTLRQNWRSFPENMLWARMMSNAVRVLAPEICAGLYTPEEVMDINEPKNNHQRQAEITPKKAKEKIKAIAKPEPEDAEVVPDFTAGESNEVNPAVCPFGKLEGKAWADLDTKVLNAALKLKNVEMTDAHRNEIKRILLTQNKKGEA
ncbi:MAG: hypothetical protein M0P69_13860 [Bacteroidales bacterium]|jgi:hypothetical protein|nr:hypothetical protein [Bacteroidales bacterium]